MLVSLLLCVLFFFFFFQAEDGIRDAQESRGLGDVYKRQDRLRERVEVYRRRRSGEHHQDQAKRADHRHDRGTDIDVRLGHRPAEDCLLYTSDAADDLLCVDLGGRRIIKKKKKHNQ